MRVEPKETVFVRYLVVKYEPLNDQYECDANRIPLYVTTDLHKAKKTKGLFEVYGITQYGKCVRIIEADY